MEADPENVSTASSYRQDAPEPKRSASDVSDSLQTDVKSVKAALSLDEVPREAYALGLAGTIPYFATSISTVYLTWNLRTQWPTDSNILNSILLNQETAAQWLSHLEVLQVGYGAAIISFLGAIHWGLEWAEKSPKEPRTRYRYAVGVLAPAIAWPTVLLPTNYALIAQFAAFTSLYFVDSSFTTRGWTPRWYGTYRFVLTAIVGGAIFVSLVFRSKGGEEGSRLSQESLIETMQGHPGGGYGKPENYSEKWAKLEEVERQKQRKEKEEEEKRKKKEEEEQKKKEEEEKKKAEKKSKGKKGGKKGDDKDSKKGDAAKASGENDADEQEESEDDGADGDDSDDGEKKQDDDSEDQKEEDSGDKEQKKGGKAKKNDKGGKEKQDTDSSDKKEQDKDDKDSGEAKDEQDDDEQKKEDGGDDESEKGEGDKDSKRKEAKGDEPEGKEKKGKSGKGEKK